MAQRPGQGQDSSPAPASAHAESGNPALQAPAVDPPVTPGIGLGAYDSTPESRTSPPSASFFADELARQDKPGAVGEAAESNQDILRRISLSGAPQRRDSLDEIDPRAANPSLHLSGGIISATFCIPHALQFIKGSEWVRPTPSLMFDDVIC